MMTFYVDEIRDYPGKGRWSHLWTDGDMEALHLFAESLGLRRTWVHHSGGLIGDFTHYDVRPGKRALAIQFGAVEMPLRDWIKQRIELMSGMANKDTTP